MASLVKICGLNTEASLDWALAAGADMVGFVFFPKSPRNVSLEAALGLGERARGRARIVALTVDADDAALDAIVTSLDPDVLQLHGRETPARVAAIRARYRRAVMKAIGVAERVDLDAGAAYQSLADYLLIDAKPPRDAALPGGNGRAFDWRLAADFRPACPWLLSGGLDAMNVADAIARTGVRAVDVSSGVESARGVKDEGKIAAFVIAARGAFARAAEGVG